MGEAPIIMLRNSSKHHTVRYILEKNGGRMAYIEKFVIEPLK